MKNYFSSFFHVSDNSEQLSKNSKNFQKKNFENFVKFFSFIIEKNEEKKFSSFFHVSDDSEQLSFLPKKIFFRNFSKSQKCQIGPGFRHLWTDFHVSGVKMLVLKN